MHSALHVSDGDTALVAEGASARVFERGGSGWSERAPLVAPREVAAIALEGERALLAFRSAAQQGGQALVYQRWGGRWWPQERLRLARPGHNKVLWMSCELDDGRALLGIHSEGDSFAESGRVALFERRDHHWRLAAEFLSSGSGRGDGFGASMVLDGTRALIGAPGSDGYAPSGA